MNTAIHVVGAGVISSIGNTYEECFLSLKNEQHGIRPLTLFESIHARTLPVGQVSLDNQALTHRVGLNKVVTRTALLGLHAAREAIAHAGLKDLSRWRTGLISATTVGGMDRTENFFPTFHRDQTAGDLADVVHHACGATTEIIANALGIHDYISTINTACSSSVNALIAGARLIENNVLDVVIAGGTDALTKFTVNGFKSLMILDTEPCRPFDATRNGLNLGEGAGFVVLVSERVLHSENLSSRATIAGFANTNDAFHQTASSPEGRGSYAAMNEALQMAGLLPDVIDYISLHGTGTVNNDLSEGTALQRLFMQKMPAVSSTKSFTGHTLGACGGIESVFALMALHHQCVFPNLRFQTAIPELNIRPQTNFQHRPVKHVMNNAFGFGGNCSSIIFSKPV